jgi:hypothetical protein
MAFCLDLDLEKLTRKIFLFFTSPFFIPNHLFLSSTEIPCPGWSQLLALIGASAAEIPWCMHGHGVPEQIQDRQGCFYGAIVVQEIIVL